MTSILVEYVIPTAAPPVLQKKRANKLSNYPEVNTLTTYRSTRPMKEKCDTLPSG